MQDIKMPTIADREKDIERTMSAVRERKAKDGYWRESGKDPESGETLWEPVTRRDKQGNTWRKKDIDKESGEPIWEMQVEEQQEDRPWYSWTPSGQAEAFRRMIPAAGGLAGTFATGGNPLGGVAGAAMGGYLAEGIKQSAYPEDAPKTMTARQMEMLDKGIWEGALESGGMGAGALIGAAAKPVGGIIKRGGQALLDVPVGPDDAIRDAATRQSIPLSRGTESRLPFVSKLESSIEQSPTIVSLPYRIQKDKSYNRIKEIVEGIDKAKTEKFGGGQAAKTSMQEGVEQKFAPGKKMYQSLEEAIADMPVNYDFAKGIYRDLSLEPSFNTAEGRAMLAKLELELYDRFPDVGSLNEYLKRLRSELRRDKYDLDEKVRMELFETALERIRDASMRTADAAEVTSKVAAIQEPTTVSVMNSLIEPQQDEFIKQSGRNVKEFMAQEDFARAAKEIGEMIYDPKVHSNPYQAIKEAEGMIQSGTVDEYLPNYVNREKLKEAGFYDWLENNSPFEAIENEGAIRYVYSGINPEYAKRQFEADQEWAKQMGRLQRVAPVVGAKKGSLKNRKQFLQKLEGMKPESLVNAMTNKENYEAMFEMALQYPEAFQYARQAKIHEMVEKATSKQGFSPQVFINQYRSMPNSVQELIFMENKKTMDDLLLVVDAFPSKTGPSGTPEGLKYHYVGQLASQLGMEVADIMRIIVLESASNMPGEFQALRGIVGKGMTGLGRFMSREGNQEITRQAVRGLAWPVREDPYQSRYNVSTKQMEKTFEVADEDKEKYIQDVMKDKQMNSMEKMKLIRLLREEGLGVAQVTEIDDIAEMPMPQQDPIGGAAELLRRSQ